MTIREHGGIFGRNPTFNNVTVASGLTVTNGKVGIGLTPSNSDPLTNVSAGLLQVNGNVELRYGGAITDPSGARYFNIVNTDTTLVAGQPLGGIQWVGLDADNPNSNMASITSYNSGNAGTTGDLRFKIAGTEKMRIDSAGNVGINNTSPISTLDVVGSITATTALSITGADSTASQVILQSFRNGAGTQTGGTVRIRSLGDGTGDATAMIIDTNSTEAMRIDGSQIVMIGTTEISPTVNDVAGAAFNSGTFSTNSDATFHRIGRRQDGTVVSFYSAGTPEGTISISGTTTSYNGGHLSRWSQTTDNTRIAGLLKGTVLTNLDQMAVWGSQANEQLNCMAVSTVEGDPNVAGVFVNWDDDDEVFTADMNVAMTGDMVIRIAAGTTVQRGDLLMSAGDGTAKPQGDDIVRSKTIAKVTSTHVSHTYADGSYAVPCVLMAC